jgi:tetratricopeptide (TPR) repeat protein
VPIGRVRWAPAARHNLMIARPDGTLPENRFGLMNISFARWGNQSAKLSFWATHLPTVSNLPPGDPAAVLDLDEDAIRWFPTDVTEYSQVGHYYLLNRQYADAVKFYSDALKHVDDRDKDRVLAARIRLWRGLARLASGDAVTAAAGKDLQYFREHIIPPKFAIPTGWDDAVFRALSTDRIFLSTLLSMGQISLAVDEAARIIEQDQDARRVQGLCYLAMIDRAIGQHELFTDGIVTQLVPRAMQSEQIPREQADRLITTYLASALHPDNQRYLSDKSKRRLAEKLVELAETMRETYPQHAVRLSESAAIFYRESGETALEMEQLRTTAEM